MSDIKNNIQKIKDSLPKNVTLCAVSKFNPAQSVIEAIEAGQAVFGENRIQEAFPKFNSIREQNYTCDLHIIGSLQRNKVSKAVQISSMIQSVDRLELIEEIEKQCAKINKTISILFELHTAEDSKSGFSDTDELYKCVELLNSNAFPHVMPKGFMTMAPFTDDKTLVQKAFKTCRTTMEQVQKAYPQLKLNVLSMGMSGDYKIAVDEGSTMVRIGTAIFGERKY